MKIKTATMLALGGLLVSLSAVAAVKATLNQNQTTLDQAVQLTIVSDQPQAAEKLDTKALDQDFTIAGRSSSSHISARNGTVSRETRIVLNLQPRREGELTIPALTIGNEQTSPLDLTVTATPDSAPVQAGDQHPGVLIEMLWENPGKVYVQGQLNLIIRIYHQGNLLEAALDEPRPADTMAIRMGEDLMGASSRDGTQYQTIERRYALFPQKSGTLIISPVVLQLRIADPDGQQTKGFRFDPYGRGKPLTLKSKPLSIEVAPPEAEFTGPTWLPSDSVILSRSGLPEQSIKLGDAVNMQVNISALGLTGEQLPEAQIEGLGDRFKLYPDQPEFSNSAEGSSIKGQRTQTFVLIPSRPGLLELPKVKLTWWDRKNHRQQISSLPAEHIEVVATEPERRDAPGSSPLPGTDGRVENTPGILAAANPNQATGIDPMWKWVSLASLLGWLLTVLYFIFRHPPQAGPTQTREKRHIATDLRPLLKKIRASAQANQARPTWQSLQIYARKCWPESPPATPEDWAARLQHPQAAESLAELDASLFKHGSATDWNGERLLTQLIPILDESSSTQRSSNATSLPALYPATRSN